MKTLSTFLKKALLAGVILGLGLLSFPAFGARAAGLNDTSTPPSDQPAISRLENAWSRTQQVYQRQGDLLGKAGGLIARVQTLIDKANGKGWDTSAVQAALDAFQSAVQDATSVHAGGAGIIASHAGFDENGKVLDKAQALATVKSLRQVLQDTRSAMNGTGKALRAAIQAFRSEHKPTASPEPSTH